MKDIKMQIPGSQYYLKFNIWTIVLMVLYLYGSYQCFATGKTLYGIGILVLAIAWFLVVPITMYFAMKNRGEICKCYQEDKTE